MVSCIWVSCRSKALDVNIAEGMLKVGWTLQTMAICLNARCSDVGREA